MGNSCGIEVVLCKRGVGVGGGWLVAQEGRDSSGSSGVGVGVEVGSGGGAGPGRCSSLTQKSHLCTQVKSKNLCL